MTISPSAGARIASETATPGVVLDRALTSPAVAIGRLPPAGRDLDLLVADPTAVAADLARAGFVGSGRRWAWLAAGRPFAVELLTPRDVGLTTRGGAVVLERARGRTGLRSVRRPAPEDAVVLLAIRVARAGSLDRRRAEVLRDLLHANPGLWDAGLQSARTAGRPAAACVRALRAAWERAEPVPRTLMVRALGMRRGGPLPGAIGALRRRRGSRAGVVVALSGLDGCGKSTQAVRLQRTLEELGLESEVVWTSLFANPRLGRLAGPVRQALARVRARPAPAPVPETWSATAPTKPPDELTHLRRRSRAITAAWTTIAVVLQARWQRRDARRALRAGRVVIADRWWLDSHVHLRYEYGSDRRFRTQMALMRRISPRADVSVYLRCAADVAHARKGEYTLEQCRVRERLYEAEHARYGALVLDATRPDDELAREIAVAAWSALAES